MACAAFSVIASKVAPSDESRSIGADSASRAARASPAADRRSAAGSFDVSRSTQRASSCSASSSRTRRSAAAMYCAFSSADEICALRRCAIGTSSSRSQLPRSTSIAVGSPPWSTRSTTPRLISCDAAMPTIAASQGCPMKRATSATASSR
ncbi:MAG: hypothetical protein U0326_38245 [Polyangiales bacterium]